LAIFFALSIAHRGLHLLLLPIYVRHITPAEYGVLAAVTIMAGVVAVLSNFKLDAAMRTFYFDYSQDEARLSLYLRQIFSLSLYCAATVYAAMLLAGSRIFDVVFVHDEVSFYPAGAIALATACTNMSLSAYFVYLRNSLRLRELVRWEALRLVATVGLQLLFVVVLDLGLSGILWASLLPTLLTAILLCVIRRDLLWARPDWAYLKPSLQYALPLVALGLLYAMGTRLDRFVLERHVDLANLGAYAILIGLLGLLNIALNVLDNTIRPYLYPRMRAAADGPAKAIDAYQRLYVAAGLMALSLAVFLGSCLHFITDNPAYLSMQGWLVLGATALVPLVLSRFYTLIYDYRKRSGSLTAGVLARFAVLYAALTLLVPSLAVGGALWAILIAESFTAVVLWFFAMRLFGIRAPLRPIASQLLIFLAALWLLDYSMRGEPRAVFGIVQLLTIAVLLLAVNRGTLRTLLTKNSGRPGMTDSVELDRRP
jgi:O-antigen/teichoic acid export membrane protein